MIRLPDKVGIKSKSSYRAPKPIKTLSAAPGQSYSFKATAPMKMFAGAERGMVQEIEIEPGDIVTVTQGSK